MHLGGIVKSATPLHAFKLAYDTRHEQGSCDRGNNGLTTVLDCCLSENQAVEFC